MTTLATIRAAIASHTTRLLSSPRTVSGAAKLLFGRTLSKLRKEEASTLLDILASLAITHPRPLDSFEIANNALSDKIEQPRTDEIHSHTLVRLQAMCRILGWEGVEDKIATRTLCLAILTPVDPTDPSKGTLVPSPPVLTVANAVARLAEGGPFPALLEGTLSGPLEVCMVVEVIPARTVQGQRFPADIVVSHEGEDTLLSEGYVWESAPRTFTPVACDHCNGTGISPHGMVGCGDCKARQSREDEITFPLLVATDLNTTGPIQDHPRQDPLGVTLGRIDAMHRREDEAKKAREDEAKKARQAREREDEAANNVTRSHLHMASVIATGLAKQAEMGSQSDGNYVTPAQAKFAETLRRTLAALSLHTHTPHRSSAELIDAARRLLALAMHEGEIARDRTEGSLWRSTGEAMDATASVLSRTLSARREARRLGPDLAAR